jgi:hypothetical protein
MKLTACLWT